MPNPKQAVLILQGHSAYNNFMTFYSMVARSLRKLDLEPVFINLRDVDEFNSGMGKAVQDFTLDNILAALTLNGLGIEMGDTSPEGNLWGRLKLPVLSWMGDHPSYFLSRHQIKSPAIVLMYEYKDYLEFNQTYVRAVGRLSYAPFGVWDLGKTPDKKQVNLSETPLIILPKTGNNPRELEQAWGQLPKKILNVIQDAINHYWTCTPRSGPVSSSVLVAADNLNLELRNDLKLFSFFIVQVDDYIRRKKAQMLVEALLPYPVKIYGTGLEYLECKNSRAQILPPLEYSHMVDLYYKSTAIINMNPNIDDECHDRVYSALGCGSLPISDINPWWNKNFSHLLPYSYDFKDQPVAAAVEKVLATPEEATQVAWQSRAIALKKRSFDDTVSEAIELARMQRYFAYNFVSPQAYFSKGKE